MALIPRAASLLLLAALAGCATGPRTPAPIEDRAAVAEPAPTPRVAPPAPAAPAPDGPVVRAIPDEPPPTAVPLPLESAPAAAPDAAVFKPANPAVGELLAQADAAASAGDFALARAQIERGLKLAPDDPLLWHQLARLSFATGDLEQARAMAERSTALATRQPALVAQNWALIGDIETRLGNASAAATAFARARAGGYGQ